jgi:capsular polysaccharide export protein
LKCCGVAIYDMPGLTFQGPLDDFWGEAPSFRPHRALLLRFRSYLIDHTQINGSFYKGGIDANLCTSMASVEHVHRAQPITPGNVA